MNKNIKKIILYCTLSILLLPKSLVFAQNIVDNFASMDHQEEEHPWANYNHLKKTEPTLLKPEFAAKNILIRNPATDETLEDGVIVYRASGVSEVVVKIYHKSGTFATLDPTAAQPTFVLGSPDDNPGLCSCFKVYRSIQDDTLYFNPNNSGWLKSFSDDGAHFAFKESDQIFKLEDLGPHLDFLGVNVSTLSYNTGIFAPVTNCSIESVKKVSLFANTASPDYFAETLRFVLPPSKTNCIKISFSALKRYKDTDGTFGRVERHENLNSLLVDSVEFIGDAISLQNYQFADDVTEESERAQTLKIQDSLPKAARVKKTQERKPSSSKQEKVKKQTKEIVTIEKYFYEQAKNSPQDLIIVSPDAASAEPEFPKENENARLEEVAAELSSTSKGSTTTNIKKQTTSKTKKNAKKPKGKSKKVKAKKSSASATLGKVAANQAEEDKITFLKPSRKSSSSEVKQKLLGFAYLGLAGATLLFSFFSGRHKPSPPK